MDEISMGFFGSRFSTHIPDFRHATWQALRLSLTFLNITTRKFAQPTNFPGKGPAEEVGLYEIEYTIYNI